MSWVIVRRDYIVRKPLTEEEKKKYLAIHEEIKKYYKEMK